MCDKYRPIYGRKSSKLTNKECLCVPTVSPLEHISTLIDIVSVLETLVRDTFNPVSASFIISASFTVPAFIPIGAFVRVVWLNEHSGILFNKSNPIHRLQIKAIYLSLNRENDWFLDTLSTL
jgi:hypothetical protein